MDKKKLPIVRICIPMLMMLAVLGCTLNSAAVRNPPEAGPDVGHPGSKSPVPPFPITMIWGHTDEKGVSDFFKGLSFTIVVGQTKDTGYLKNLHDNNGLYAYRVDANPDNWDAPMKEELVDAIAIDELTKPDAASTTPATIDALKSLRARYPDKGIYVAVPRYFAWPIFWRLCARQLKAFEDLECVLMLEYYTAEGDTFPYFNRDYAVIARHFPRLATRTIFLLGIVDRGMTLDNRADLAFTGHLDAQFHMIRNGAASRAMPGIGGWSRGYYSNECRDATMSEDSTVRFFNSLCQHYYGEGKTDWYGSGSRTQLIANPGFEEGTGGWTLDSGASRVQYDGALPNNHGYNILFNGPSAWHGNWYLLMRGDGSKPAAASWTTGRLSPGTWYRASAWVHPAPGRESAAAGVEVIEVDTGKVVGASSTDIAGKNPRYYFCKGWTRITVEFQCDQASAYSVRLVSPQTNTPCTAICWDFVELEQKK